MGIELYQVSNKMSVWHLGHRSKGIKIIIMIVWQLMNVLAENKESIEILSTYNSSDILPEPMVVKFLSSSQEVFSICKDGNLRSNVENYAFKIEVIEILNALEAYQRFGGQALSEVIDYGSWKIPDHYS